MLILHKHLSTDLYWRLVTGPHTTFWVHDWKAFHADIVTPRVEMIHIPICSLLVGKFFRFLWIFLYKHWPDVYKAIWTASIHHQRALAKWSRGRREQNSPYSWSCVGHKVNVKSLFTKAQERAWKRQALEIFQKHYFSTELVQICKWYPLALMGKIEAF